MFPACYPPLARRLVAPLLFALPLLAVSSARAQGGAPLLTDDTGTPAAQTWELTASASLVDSRAVTEMSLPALEIVYGFTERLQLGLAVAETIAQHPGDPWRHGRGDWVLGAKWRFLEDGPGGLAASVAPRWEKNFSDRSIALGLAEPGSAFFLPFQVQGRLAGDLGWNIDLGRTLGSRETEWWHLGLCIGGPVASRLELAGELYAESEHLLRDSVLKAGIGLRYALGERTLLLLSAGTDLRTQDEPRTRFGTVAVQWTFGSP